MIWLESFKRELEQNQARSRIGKFVMRTTRSAPSSLRPFGWCFVLFLISTQSWGQETGCISGDCVNGQGTYTSASGTKYVGEFRDDRINGQGTLTSTNGANYVGKFRDDKRHGHGTDAKPCCAGGGGRSPLIQGDIYNNQLHFELFLAVNQSRCTLKTYK